MQSCEPIDRLLIAVDRGLRTLFAAHHPQRAEPAAAEPEPELNEAQKKLAASLMRVNHTGEVCAQALYEGQMLTARDPEVKRVLARAADEETDHLAWTESRIRALGGRTSYLNPLFYAGSFALGAAAGLIGDRWNLGFLAETERQVESHLTGHLDRLPNEDSKSKAVVEQMRADEAQHARSAIDHGGAELPQPIKQVMGFASKVMTETTFHI